jgi:hypothetical protein
VADVDYAPQADELSFILVATQQLGVITEIAQEPVQLPALFEGQLRKDKPSKLARLKLFLHRELPS